MDNINLKTLGEKVAMVLEQIQRVSITLKKKMRRHGQTMYASYFLAIGEAESHLQGNQADLKAWASINKAQGSLKEAKREKLEETKNKTIALQNRWMLDA